MRFLTVLYIDFRLFSLCTVYVYPAYASFKVASSGSEPDLRRWVRYWAALALIIAFDAIFEDIRSLITRSRSCATVLPFTIPFSILQSVLLLFLAIPQAQYVVGRINPVAIKERVLPAVAVGARTVQEAGKKQWSLYGPVVTQAGRTIVDTFSVAIPRHIQSSVQRQGSGAPEGASSPKGLDVVPEQIEAAAEASVVPTTVLDKAVEHSPLIQRRPSSPKGSPQESSSSPVSVGARLKTE